jgi:hypothetical protein
MPETITKDDKQIYIAVGVICILISIALLVYVFYLQWHASVTS